MDFASFRRRLSLDTGDGSDDDRASAIKNSITEGSSKIFGSVMSKKSGLLDGLSSKFDQVTQVLGNEDQKQVSSNNGVVPPETTGSPTSRVPPPKPPAPAGYSRTANSPMSRQYSADPGSGSPPMSPRTASSRASPSLGKQGRQVSLPAQPYGGSSSTFSRSGILDGIPSLRNTHDSSQKSRADRPGWSNDVTHEIQPEQLDMSSNPKPTADYSSSQTTEVPVVTDTSASYVSPYAQKVMNMGSSIKGQTTTSQAPTGSSAVGAGGGYGGVSNAKSKYNTSNSDVLSSYSAKASHSGNVSATRGLVDTGTSGGQSAVRENRSSSSSGSASNISSRYSGNSTGGGGQGSYGASNAARSSYSSQASAGATSQRAPATSAPPQRAPATSAPSQRAPATSAAPQRAPATSAPSQRAPVTSAAPRAPIPPHTSGTSAQWSDTHNAAGSSARGAAGSTYSASSQPATHNSSYLSTSNNADGDRDLLAITPTSGAALPMPAIKPTAPGPTSRGAAGARGRGGGGASAGGYASDDSSATEGCDEVQSDIEDDLDYNGDIEPSEDDIITAGAAGKTPQFSTEGLDDLSRECLEFMNGFVDKIFISQSITQSEKAKFGQLCQQWPGRLWFSRYVNAKRMNKLVEEQVFYQLVQYLAVCLFECNDAEDYVPAKTLMNMCFTFYYEAQQPSGEATKQYLYSFLKDQPIWQETRFWKAAFFDAVQQERARKPMSKRGDGSDSQIDDKEFQENITFGQLGTFTSNMRAFGLSKELCLEFIKKQAAIANLREDQVRMLQENMEKWSD